MSLLPRRLPRISPLAALAFASALGSVCAIWVASGVGFLPEEPMLDEIEELPARFAHLESEATPVPVHRGVIRQPTPATVPAREADLVQSEPCKRQVDHEIAESAGVLGALRDGGPHSGRSGVAAPAGNGVNPTTLTEVDAQSTFSIDVDTASYAIARRKLQGGIMPSSAGVRVEEFVNYLPYDYAAPISGRPFAVHMEAAPNPFRAGHHVLRVGVRGRDLSGNIRTIARDVKIQVEFGPEQVLAYRLLGYENHDIADRDFRNDGVDAGEVGSGHRVTALYDVVLSDAGEGALASVHLRAKPPGPDAPAAEWSTRFGRDAVRSSFASASPDFRIATGTAGFAEKLRGSPYMDEVSYRQVASVVRDALRPHHDEDGELLELIGQAAELVGEGALARR